MQLPPQIGDAALRGRIRAFQSSLGVPQLPGSLVDGGCLVPKLALQIRDLAGHGVQVMGGVRKVPLQSGHLLLLLIEDGLQGLLLLLGLRELLLENGAAIVGLLQLPFQLSDAELCRGLDIVQIGLRIPETTDYAFGLSSLVVQAALKLRNLLAICIDLADNRIGQVFLLSLHLTIHVSEVALQLPLLLPGLAQLLLHGAAISIRLPQLMLQIRNLTLRSGDGAVEDRLSLLEVCGCLCCL